MCMHQSIHMKSYTTRAEYALLMMWQRQSDNTTWFKRFKSWQDSLNLVLINFEAIQLRRHMAINDSSSKTI